MNPVGEKTERVVNLWATACSCPPGCPHGPKGSGWSEGLVHKYTGWGAPLDGVEDTQQVKKEYRAERRPLRRWQEGDAKLTGHPRCAATQDRALYPPMPADVVIVTQASFTAQVG